MLSSDVQSIQTFLHDRVLLAWRETGEPYLLSLIATDLKNAGVDYRSVLFGEKLKEFVMRTQGEKTYRVVQHPTHLAKVGLIPHDANFEFQPEHKRRLEVEEAHTDNARGADSARGVRLNKEATVVGFLRLLGQLPASELGAINIPVSALAKLLK